MQCIKTVVARVICLLHDYPVPAFGCLIFAGTIMILLNFFFLARQLNTNSAMQYAAFFMKTMDTLRDEYTTKVTERVGPSVPVTDMYQRQAGAIPFPATFAIDFADAISDNGKVARIYSDFPFPSRQTGGPQDAYEWQALASLRANPKVPFTRLEEFRGRLSLRYASAIHFTQPQCVTCHNQRQGSPKTDWQIGDVRGVQELVLPLDSALHMTLQGLSTTLCMMLALAGGGLGVLALVINKLRGSLQQVQTLAQETADANHTLVQTNMAYNRFVPHAFLSFLQKESIMEVELGDHVQQEMTVLFADIRDFTTLSEILEPADNFQFINAYLSAMGPIVREYHGFIDKYIGDAIMALFQDANSALDAAIAMLLRLAQCNATWARQYGAPINVGIGLNTGTLMLGTVGESHRMEGTVISDAVNLASRTEDLTKLYGASLLISQYTLAQLRHPEQYLIRVLDRVKVKGKQVAVLVYEVCDANPTAIRERQATTQAVFTEAFRLYQARQFEAAKTLYATCLATHPEDQAAALLLKRCDDYIRNGCTAGWDGTPEQKAHICCAATPVAAHLLV